MLYDGTPSQTLANKRETSSSSSGKAKSANKARVRFIFEPDRSSPNGVTFSWLLHKTYKGKEKAATATRAFWLPFAYRDSGDYSEAELRELAQQSIWKMAEQIQHLREAFGLETTARPVVSAAPVQTTPLEGATAVGIMTEVTTPLSTSAVENAQTQSLPISTEEDLLAEFADVL